MTVMQITDYTTLKAAVASYLSRTDLTDQIPMFIHLAEQDLRRNLLPEPIHVGRTLDADQDLHAVIGELVSITMDTDAYKHPITIVSFATLAELRRTGSGVPYYGAVIGSSIYFDVVVDSDYDVIEIYRPDFEPLTTAEPTNALILTAPDAYLYGALKEAAPYLEHDERNVLWAQKYQKAVTDENIARERAQFGAGPLVPRFPIILG